MRTDYFKPCFVEFVPARLDPGILYISLEYATVSHLCPCACGNRVVTPLGPADWQLIFDGSVSLRPSIGNGQIACRSHYFIRGDRVIWALPMTREQTRRAQSRDKAALVAQTAQATDIAVNPPASAWARITSFLRRRFGSSGHR
ncbi:hypothetical protein GCM10023346_46780 [Arthrobacter gyeryongensis]|uniref:Uncharacterized protein n=1 Tax=Arthrobacter gyeryongensis TaxID=1650592 RepID=A0ABP9SS26_9MICC